MENYFITHTISKEKKCSCNVVNCFSPIFRRDSNSMEIKCFENIKFDFFQLCNNK